MVRGPKTFLLAGAIAAGLALLAGCGGTTDGVGGERWNVLLVTFDTTRADHIGCYGRERAATPNLDRLAAEGIRFARAMASVPITAPSHSTILTGNTPLAHGVRDNGLFVLGDEQQTLAEILRGEGYATAAAVGAYPLVAQFGLDQGFDLYDDHLTGIFEDYRGVRAVPKKTMFFDERRAAQVNEAVLPWLSERASDPQDRPFFAWVHYFDPHQPFEPAPPYDQLFADSLYDGEIAYADSRLGFLLDHLDRLGELERTLVVMTADHGEGLGEHGEVTHAILAHDSTLHVPLIVRPPGEVPARGTVVEQRVGTVNILPTILDLLGIEVPETVQGHSLVPYWVEGREPSRWTAINYAENLSPRLTHGWGELRVLAEGSSKYIHGPEPQLFDLSVDPGELDDLAAERPEETARMRRRLEGFIRRFAVDGASTARSVDDEVRQRLESLGYLQSGGTGGEVVVERLRSDGLPPRSQVSRISDLSAVKQLIHDGRGADAQVYLKRLLASTPDNPLYLELQVVAWLQSGRRNDAWRMASELAEEGSLSEEVMLHVAWSEFEHGDRRTAYASLNRYLAHRDSAQGSWLLASFAKSLGEAREARTALERALDHDPSFAPARVNLAVAMDRAGEPGVEEQFLRALDDAPYYGPGFFNYGVFLLQYGRDDEAIRRFERAAAVAPGYLEAHLALVAAYSDARRPVDARRAYRALEELAPESPQAAAAREMLDAVTTR